VPAVFLGVLVHELGHAAAMRAYGRAPWITLYGFGGLTSSDMSGLYRGRGFATLGQIIISVAGPAAGFLLAAVVVLLAELAGYRIRFALGLPDGLEIGLELIGSEAFTAFVYYLLFVSIYWGLLNLLPIYPLDGGQIAREVFLKLSPRQGIERSLMLSVATAAGMAVVGLLLWRELFVAILFGYLAWSSYATLQAYRQPW
jgi:membrane-associated protease RseP (regulator of RpoE activity)